MEQTEQTTETKELTFDDKLKTVKEFLSDSQVKEYFKNPENKDGWKLIEPFAGKYVQDGIEKYKTTTFKETELPKYREQIIKEINPEETETEKKLRIIEEKLAAKEKSEARLLREKNLKKFSEENKFDSDFIDLALLKEKDEDAQEVIKKWNEKINLKIMEGVESKTTGRTAPVKHNDLNPETVDLDNLSKINDPDYFIKNAEEIDRLLNK